MRRFLSAAIILLIFAQFLAILPIGGQPVPVGDTVQSNPFESNPTAGSTVGSPTGGFTGTVDNAKDGDFGSNINWRIGGGTQGATVGVEMTPFENSPPAGTFTIGWVDLKVNYKASATTNDQYRIIYKVGSGGTWQPLQDWISGASAKFDYNGAQDERCWSNVAEPDNGVWDWTDIGNVYFRVETMRTDTTEDSILNRFYLHEVWLTIYEGAYPGPGTTVSIQPPVVGGLGMGSSFFIDVFVTGVSNMHGFQFKINYDESILMGVDYFAYNPFILAAPSELSSNGTFLYVKPPGADGFTNRISQWTVHGTDPYLDAEDYPTDYVNTATTDAQIGDFCFVPISMMFSKRVYLEINAMNVNPTGDDAVEIWLYDEGTSNYVNVGTITPDAGAPSWKGTGDLQSILGTVDKINNAKVYLVKKTVGSEDDIVVDAMRLWIPETGYARVAFSSYMSDSIGFTGSEPVVRIYFMVDADGTSLLHISKSLLSNTVGEPITHTLNDGIFATTPVHDVAVINVEVNATQVMPGGYVEVNVTVANQGTFFETFDVTAYNDSTPIGSPQTVTNLGLGLTETLSFDWDTTGVAVGLYQVKAVASTVSGETETDDNTFIDGMVLVGKHDIAVTDVTRIYYNATSGEYVAVSPSVQYLNVTQGEKVYANVTVANLGTFSETFKVTAFYWNTWEASPDRTIIIGTNASVSLDAGVSQTLNYTWNTIGVKFERPYITPQGRTVYPNISYCDVRANLTMVPYEKGSDYDFTADNVRINNWVNVTRSAPKANFDIDKIKPYVGEPVEFAARLSQTPKGTTLTWFWWDFGDGVIEKYQVGVNTTLPHAAKHSYATAGHYRVNLTVFNNAGINDTYSAPAPPNYVTAYARNIDVLKVVPNATIAVIGEIVPVDVTVKNAGGQTENEIHLALYYNNTMITKSKIIGLGNGSSNTTRFMWNTTGLSPGIYTVKVIAGNVTLQPLQYEINLTDNTLTYSGVVTLFEAPIVSFTHGPAKPYVSQPVSFNASSTIDPDSVSGTLPHGNITSYVWDFGDGSTAAFVRGTNLTVTVQHAYAVHGTYIVNLTVTDNDGFSRSKVQNVTVYIRDLSVYSVEVSVGSVTAGETVTISVTVLNKGELPDSFEVAVKSSRDGGPDEDIDSADVTNLAAGGFTTVTFDWDTSGWAAGAHTIKAFVDSDWDRDVADNSGVDGVVNISAPTNWLLYGGIIAVVAVVVVAVAVYFLKFRKKSKAP